MRRVSNVARIFRALRQKIIITQIITHTKKAGSATCPRVRLHRARTSVPVALSPVKVGNPRNRPARPRPAPRRKCRALALWCVRPVGRHVARPDLAVRPCPACRSPCGRPASGSSSANVRADLRKGNPSPRRSPSVAGRVARSRAGRPVTFEGRQPSQPSGPSVPAPRRKCRALALWCVRPVGRLVVRLGRAPRPCAPCRASRGRPASSSNPPRRSTEGQPVPVSDLRPTSGNP